MNKGMAGHPSKHCDTLQLTAESKRRKQSPQTPLWLRRLDRVKAELKGVRFPRTAEEGFRQCAELSAAALHLLREEVRKSHPGASEEQVELEMRRLLARFSAADARWVARWRKERARYFGR